jgi:uncharacterized Zn finger protein
MKKSLRKGNMLRLEAKKNLIDCILKYSEHVYYVLVTLIYLNDAQIRCVLNVIKEDIRQKTVNLRKEMYVSNARHLGIHLFNV